MTPQQIYDKVALHLYTQNEKCTLVSETFCRYRLGPLRCAAGCLIDDEHYDPEMEDKDIGIVVRNFPLPEWMTTHLDLINELQIIHDTYPPYEWEAQLTNLAADLELTPMRRPS